MATLTISGNTLNYNSSLSSFSIPLTGNLTITSNNIRGIVRISYEGHTYTLYHKYIDGFSSTSGLLSFIQDAQNDAIIQGHQHQVFYATAGQTEFETTFAITDEYWLTVDGMPTMTGHSKTASKQVTFSSGQAQGTQIVIYK